ncbi:hypothetical protein E8E12_001539 [Didymella heteroderae]|uniref:Uncharacterized protein n=1 Tax=Didymella heteroderae TaxID=1769908 RepID=A0A9P5BVB5_9PLEO|nr:hypothetical protein E8E12_001539 [Didymella heteroderae]
MAEMGRLTLKELDRVCGPTEKLDQQSTGEPPPRQGSVAPATIAVAEMPPNSTKQHDSYYITGIPGPDPFEMFDPNFDLIGIDSFFEGA